MIAVLGSGQWQMPLINLIEKKGQKIILISPLIDNQLKKHLFIEENLKNIDKIIHELSFYKDLRFAISDQSDIGIRVSAEINSRLNLEGLKSETASYFWDKFKFDKMISIIDSNKSKNTKIIQNTEDISNYFLKYGRSVIKPIDGQSSKGVFLISNKNEIEELYQMSISESINSEVIIEPFIDGIEYTLEALVIDGQVEILGLSEKSHMSFGIANSLNYSINLKNKYHDTFIDILNKITDYTGLENGLIHCEFIESENSIKIIEMGCRGGGTYISSHILPLLNGFSPIEKVINNLISKDELEEYTKYDFVSLKFFNFTKKIANKNNIVKEIKSLKDRVEVCIIDLNDNEAPLKASDDRSRHGFVILKSNSHLEMELTIKSINNIIGYEAIS